MLQATTNPAVRDAIKSAHAERGRLAVSAWSWLFNRSSR